MQQVIPEISIVNKILGNQQIVHGLSYRLSIHCMQIERLEGVLLYHTLTEELLLLSHDEADLLGLLPGPVPPAIIGLVPGRFLVPETADDMALADLVRNIVSRSQSINDVKSKFKIFTTMECNARCFYCYESAWKKSTMTEQIAMDTANYILTHRGGKPVRLDWFGGEPLVNTRAIDVITDCLRQHGVEFHSTMASNGYLFDEETVHRARINWNLDEVQITLDGTEKIYNQRKAYINPQGSPFQRVLRNIVMLLSTNILVRVRLNIDDNNEEDIYALCDELAERFAGISGFGVTLAPLCNHVEGIPLRYPDAHKFGQLCAYIEGLGIAVSEPQRRGIITNSCMADSDCYTTVTPEGNLGRCNSCLDGAIWGSIYSDERNESVICQWKEHKQPEEACQTCVVYPQCVRLKRCPSWGENCSPIERTYREDGIRRAALGTYEKWKGNGRI